MTELHHPAVERAPPHTMRAVVIAKPGGPEVLELRDVALPSPGPNQIRVRVRASAVNRADLLQRAGNYPVPADAPQDIPGLEYSGVVDALGDGVTRWNVGDAVMGLVGGGSYAHFLLTHEDEALRIPPRLGFEAAAAVPEAFITAHDALLTQMNLRRDDVLLIHAVGSGVGTAALQIANHLGARVFGTQRSAWKLERAAALGLAHPIDASSSDFAEAVLHATDGYGADGILDLVGGAYLAGNLRAAALRGRIMLVGLIAGASAELDMRTVLRKRLTLRGTVLRARSQIEKVAAARAFERDVMPLLISGAVAPIVDAILPLADARRAHEMVAANQNFGKIVLSMR